MGGGVLQWHEEIIAIITLWSYASCIDYMPWKFFRSLAITFY